jgi:hypothetical protein
MLLKQQHRATGALASAPLTIQIGGAAFKHYGPRVSMMFWTSSSSGLAGLCLAVILQCLPAIGCALSWLDIWKTWPSSLMNTTFPLVSEQFVLHVALPELWSTHLALQTPASHLGGVAVLVPVSSEQEGRRTKKDCDEQQSNSLHSCLLR